MTEQPGDNKKGGARLNTPEKKPGTKKERVIMAVMIVVAVLMVIAAAVAVLYNRWVKKPSLPAGEDPSASDASGVRPGADEALNPDVSDDPDIDPVEPKVSGERKSDDFYTVLVFGADVTSGLTDTIMLASYDITNQNATVMSIPRDTLVNVRSRSSKSINAVYSNNGKGESGLKALVGEVSELVGFTPDFYVMIDWELVGLMVDAIGGVDYDIPWHMGYDDPYQDLHIHFEAGLQHLDGEDAMNLVRWRKNNDGTKTEGGGGDTSRLDVQHDFLKAVLKQTLQLTNVTKIRQLAALFGENVESDLTIENLLWFASQAIFGGLNVDDVQFVTMPYYGVSSGVYKDRIYPNQRQLLALINESLNPFVEEVTIKQLDLIRVSSDGNTLSSSTGKLADASAAVAPASSSKPVSSGDSGDEEESAEPSVSKNPTESSSPSESSAPSESSRPAASDGPAESGNPSESGSPPESGSPGGEEPEVSEAPAPEETVEPTPGSEPEPSESVTQPDPSPAPSDPLPAASTPDWLQPDTSS